MKDKLLFEIVVSRQCNKRCSYCDLDFSSEYISNDTIDNAIAYFLKISSDIESLSINFFGGEPLLAIDKIEYFIFQLQKYKINANLSIGTNGLLLDTEKLRFFQKHNFNIYFSIDTETGIQALEKNDFGEFLDMFEINFILNPKTLTISYKIFEKVVESGFKNINIMPVFGTIDWGKDDLIALKRFVVFSYGFDSIQCNYYKYFNDVSIEKQFMLEIDGEIYSDLDSLLWIQRQNHDIVSEELIREIYEKTSIGNIGKLQSREELLRGYNIKDIIKLVFSIPMEQGNKEVYKIIDLIMQKPEN